MHAMRAALYNEFGKPGVIYEGELPIPGISADDVLVHVEAASINGSDLLMRSGQLKAISGKRFPQRIGIDVVGTVVDTGSRVSEYRVGDRVWGVLPPGRKPGTIAHFAALPSIHVSAAPETLDSREAASVLVGGATSMTGLRGKARLEPRERLLVRGAGGGVGTMAIQIGKQLGAHVTALASTQQAPALRALGADSVLDYRNTAISDLGSYDVIFDTRGTDLGQVRRRLTSAGRMVTISFDAEHPLRSLSAVASSTVFGRQRIRFFSGRPTTSLLQELRTLVDRGEIRPAIHRTYSLPHVAAAHLALEAGGVLGKIIIDLNHNDSAAVGQILGDSRETFSSSTFPRLKPS